MRKTIVAAVFAALVGSGLLVGAGSTAPISPTTDQGITETLALYQSSTRANVRTNTRKPRNSHVGGTGRF